MIVSQQTSPDFLARETKSMELTDIRFLAQNDSNITGMATSGNSIRHSTRGRNSEELGNQAEIHELNTPTRFLVSQCGDFRSFQPRRSGQNCGCEKFSERSRPRISAVSDGSSNVDPDLTKHKPRTWNRKGHLAAQLSHEHCADFLSHKSGMLSSKDSLSHKSVSLRPPRESTPDPCVCGWPLCTLGTRLGKIRPRDLAVTNIFLFLLMVTLTFAPMGSTAQSVPAVSTVQPMLSGVANSSGPRSLPGVDRINTTSPKTEPIGVGGVSTATEDQPIKLDVTNASLAEQPIKLDVTNASLVEQPIKLDVTNANSVGQPIKLDVTNANSAEQPIKLDTPSIPPTKAAVTAISFSTIARPIRSSVNASASTSYMMQQGPPPGRQATPRGRLRFPEVLYLGVLLPGNESEAINTRLVNPVVQIARDEVKSRNILPAVRSIEVEVRDSQSSAVEGPLAAMAMVKEGLVNAFFGPVSANPLSATALYCTEWEIPIFTTKGEITDFNEKKVEYRTLTRMMSTYGKSSVAVAEVLDLFEIRMAGLLYDNIGINKVSECYHILEPVFDRIKENTGNSKDIYHGSFDDSNQEMKKNFTKLLLDASLKCRSEYC